MDCHLTVDVVVVVEHGHEAAIGHLVEIADEEARDDLQVVCSGVAEIAHGPIAEIWKALANRGHEIFEKNLRVGVGRAEGVPADWYRALVGKVDEKGRLPITSRRTDENELAVEVPKEEVVQARARENVGPPSGQKDFGDESGSLIGSREVVR